MFEIVKKSVYTGLGLASLTREKIEKFASDLSKEAQLSEEEGRRLHEELQLKAEESKEHLGAQIDERIDQALVQVGLVRAGVKRVADRTTDTLQQMVDKRVDQALERLGVARKEEVASLLQRIELLESKVSAPKAVEQVG
jgi:polyhydroxyalkanoate synthesis regulator phasin